MLEAALLLVGGRSSRFGGSKAAHLWQGEALGARAARLLAGVALQVTAVGAPGPRPDWLPSDCRYVADPFPHGGPVVGLVAGFEAVEGEWVAVAPCDIPRLTTETYRKLTAAAQGERVSAIAAWQGRVQPLVGVYQRAAALTLGRRLLAEGELRARKFAAELTPKLVELAEAATNINYRRDLARLEAD